MYTQVVMFRTGSRPSDEKKGGGGGGGDHPVLEIRRGGGRAAPLPPLNPPLMFNRRTEVYLG